MTITASIAVLGEIDSYIYTASAGDAVTIRMVSTTTSVSITRFLELRDSNNNLLTSGVTSITRQLTAAGSYTIRARDFLGGGTGNYNLFLQRLNSPCGATSITVGQVIAGTIGSVGEFDTYLLQGVSQGSTVTICMGSNAFDPSLELFDGAGTRVAIGPTISGQLNGPPPYSIIVSDSLAFRTGNYKLLYAAAKFLVCQLIYETP